MMNFRLKKPALCFMIITSLIFVPPLTPALADADVEASSAGAANAAAVPQLDAKAAVLIDGMSGNTLFEKNSNEKLPIASVTKIMTMLLIMEAIDGDKIQFDNNVRVSDHSYNMGGSQVWLKPGEEFTVKEMMNAVAIHSANDAAVALAEFISGSEEVFVAEMNKKAADLGMRDTKFLDCTGLTDEGHYSSARDIAVMSRELLSKHPSIIDFTKTWHAMFREKDAEHKVSLDNTNKLIRHYNGTIGLKTGFTSKAGHCLCAAAVRNDLTLISVVLGERDSNTRFAESKKLLDYGFSNYEIMQVSQKGEEIATVDVKKGIESNVRGVLKEDVKLLIKKGEKGELEKKTEVDPNVEAPVKAGQKIGEIIYFMSGKEIGKAEIAAENDVERASFAKLFSMMMVSWFSLGRR
ncbi:D-alanyl-D-alanine carboxypeptidase (penicillin-binding protein 5/6) [Anaerobacterium chartisolvens]|uniref:serine-type D-Ala-D-Ala carboxypeptidase n=1 Tax=Anaerobacterium chartisolvens TaxID=1297424 RepID=A0A369BCN8_9FIRM|nr:D-alanyl-D-alanine carboxypeptidase family protein [Anaerobacterium chartisolvens]RCX19310.1 D-alanyl-D-alanine carboxypeptidase (penicillin-binding protein 5/6) [Anaerobacterium chartisolvens]